MSTTTQPQPKALPAPARAGRRKKARLSAEDRKAAIVESAVRLFSSKGFRGTTTRELAAACGVSEPVLYSHFATKRDLYDAIIEGNCEEEEQTCNCAALDRAAATSNDEAYLTTMAGQLLDWYDKHPELVRLLMFSALEGHELSDLFYERHVAVYYQMLTGYLKRRMKEGAFRRMDAYEAARSFTGSIAHQGMVTAVFHGPRLRGTSKQIARRMVRIFLNGIRKPSTS